MNEIDPFQRWNESSNETPRASLTARHMESLWTRMVRIYGHRWTSGFGEADDGTWLAGLQGLTAGHLADGLRACIQRNEGWPPSLPEFRALCLGIPDAEAAAHGMLAGTTPGALAERMAATLDSWTRKHMTRDELVRHYRAVYDSCVRELIEDEISEARRLAAAPGGPHSAPGSESGS